MMVPFSCMAGIAWTSLQFWYSCNSGVVELHVLVGQRWCRPASGSHTVSSSASLRVTDSLGDSWAQWFNRPASGSQTVLAIVGHPVSRGCITISEC